VADKTPSTAVSTLRLTDVDNSRKAFIAGEPRYLFYLVATELIDLSRKKITKKVSVAQALAVLLQTWNVSFYRFRGGFREEDLTKIEALLNENLAAIEKYRERSIASLESSEQEELRTLFGRFESVLGSVGAAKCLHLLAPGFFPLWDRAIAKAYKVKCDRDGYIHFMCIAKEQCRGLEEQGAVWPDLLKAIDEYNYCIFTLKTGESI
jgi:hypothetical protein